MSFVIPLLFYLGNDQTTVEQLQAKDQEMMKEEILNLLGLDHAPQAGIHPSIKDFRSNQNHAVSTNESQLKSNDLINCTI